MRKETFKQKFLLNKNLRGLLLFLVFLIGFLTSCEGQTPKPIKIDVSGTSTDIKLTVDSDTIFITEIDTIFIDKPFEVVVRDTIYQDKIVEVIKEVEVIKRDTILRDYTYDEMKELVYLWAEADTIRAWSDVVNLDYTDAGLRPTEKPTIYTFIYGIGIVPVEMDTIYSWQRVFDIERVKTISNTKYRSIGLPFQFRNVWFSNEKESSVVINYTVTEDAVRTTCWVDGVKYKEFLPGSSTKKSELEWYAWFTINNLEKGKSYEIKLEKESLSGEIAMRTITLDF